MALAAARARVLRALSRPPPPGRVPVAARRCCSDAGSPAALPPGGYGVWQERAARDPAGFWAEVARGALRWDSPFHTACQAGPAAGATRWFLGGRLNVSVNCLDQHVEKSPNRVALIWERDEPGTAVHVTYRELLDQTCRLANTLKKYGIQKGDKVAIYMSVSPLSVAAMLACARIGAIHTVVFPGFSAESLAGRIMDSGCKAVITYNQGVRGGRIIELKTTVDEAVKNCPSIKHVFVAQRTDNKVWMGDRDVPLEEEMAKAASVCTPESMDSEDMLFMLYTSGSTGKPKGIVHTQAGYLLYAALTHKYVFDYQQGDVFGCVADIGWITGHSYVVYGPLCNGATSVLFESTPVYPDPGRYWEVVQRLKINQFYGAPTAIRLLLNYGEEWVKKYDRSSLKTLGSVGEPINHEAWQWFYHVVGEGRCTLVDTWWQTETGGICIAPRPSEEKAEIIPAMAMRPFFGIVPVLMDENGKVIEGNDVSGALCIAQPWPGMARTIYGDHQRFVDAYFKAYPGYYFTGDGAYRTKQGYYQITGRMDDVINISGHRLGTAEIEDAMADHPEVPETAVIGYPHKIKGEGAFAFIVLKEQTAHIDRVKEELKTIVASKIAKYAVPDHILLFSLTLGALMNSRLCFKLAHLSAAPFCVFGESAQSCPLAGPQDPSASSPHSAWRQWPHHFFEGLCLSHMLGKWTPRPRLQNTTGVGKGGSLNLEQPKTSSVDWSSSQNLQVVKRLPKTRSGKIMRRLLRKVVTEQSSNMGDVTTLDDPSVVKEILDAYQKYKEKSSS
ncbi:acetyl-coenzyme A synthetase 2-like, mitochondrial isoform X2 [Calonectris borealis]|uniref:acetyl-coenzyme A synthetase 2-like, mitochondrial isoform X2 n=1 Tax=Calonectris borealis TaxID=1323832 RepID=UPI003F4B6ECA